MTPRAADTIETAWDQLLRWAAEQRETRCVEVKVFAGDPEWDEDTDAIAHQPYSYEITASETVEWGDEVPGGDIGLGTHAWHGIGESLDAAAAVALGMMHPSEPYPWDVCTIAGYIPASQQWVDSMRDVAP